MPETGQTVVMPRQYWKLTRWPEGSGVPESEVRTFSLGDSEHVTQHTFLSLQSSISTIVDDNLCWIDRLDPVKQYQCLLSEAISLKKALGSRTLLALSVERREPSPSDLS